MRVARQPGHAMKARQATAARYAKALFALARESGSVDAVARELQQVLEVFVAQPGFRAVLLRPWVKPAERREVAVAVAQRAGCEKLVRDFAGLVAARGRADHLPEMVQAYGRLVDEALGQVRAAVRTAVALAEEEKADLAMGLGRTLGKRVTVEETLDRSVLGGFVAQIGSLIVDGSLDGQLRRMRERLARG